MNPDGVLKNNKIIPIAVFTNVSNALKTAELLLNNSVDILEVTLRTGIAFDCIYEISKKFPELVLGAGSVLEKDALKKASDSGAKFGVAPGLDLSLLKFAYSKKITFIPGVSTPTELNTALNESLHLVKLFPASNLGGPAYIKAVTAPFRMKDFYLIPTGGITEANILEYLNTDKVIACGASYVIDSKLIDNGDFDELNRRISKTAELLFP
ncbi:MAG: bifunctional 4-hydroxy-2-oxoglutarate aldolase/2-dehydro-3-deoxy-phosphogluconate aldolase [Spirochaetes bacterium]|nr:bifunctional 4-hydroxy-2-oxoglutarate aldolase/2-dehydro-3-deoxy-phosphogluconate aldolase [Spirochaetota bacterium]